jgi:hypothetical protein
MSGRYTVPASVRTRFEEIVGLVEAICLSHLTEEYATVARELTAALARKRPSPLLRGQSRTWACGVTYTIGRINVLCDPTQRRHVERLPAGARRRRVLVPRRTPRCISDGRRLKSSFPACRYSWY